MKSFYTESRIQLFAHVNYAIEKKFGKHELYEKDVMKLIFHYGLYDESQHTVEKAIEAGNIPVLEFLLPEDSPLPYFRNWSTYRWFYMAAKYGRLEAFQLLEKRGNIDSQEYPHLMENSILSKNLDMVKYIEQSHYIESNQYNFMLDNCAATGDIEILKFIVQKAANNLSIWSINSALGGAAKQGFVDMVDYLISLGANCNAFAGSPLVKACESGHFNVVKKLIDSGADINIRLGQALHVAAESGHLDIVRYLVDLGIEAPILPYRAEEDGDMHLAAGKHYYEIVRILANHKMLDCNLALWHAILSKDPLMVEIILESPLAKRDSEYTSLQEYALENDMIEIFLALEKHPI